MSELVTVSSVENKEKLKSNLEDLFKRERYSEIGEAIGMHSILIDPQNTIADQANLYHFILDMIKDRIRTAKGKGYSAWYTGFPKALDQIAAGNQIITDKRSTDVLASRRAAFGLFKSLDDFFFWALEERRLPLAHIMKYIEKTA
jgi:hypothetical protein